MTLNVYLASRYSRYEEMQGYAAQLVEVGCSVMSRWIQGDHQMSDRKVTDEAEQLERIRFAEEDVLDLRAASVVINFTEQPRATNTRGGRHVEFGMALAMGKKLVVVGHRENVFHCLPEVAYFPVWEGALDHVRMMAYRQEIAHIPHRPPSERGVQTRGDVL